MDTTIDSVSVEIESNSSKASKGLDGLIATIEKLKKATENGVSGLSELNNEIKNLTSNFSGVSKISSSFKGLSTEAKTLKNSVKDLSLNKFTGNSQDIERQRQILEKYRKTREDVSKNDNLGSGSGLDRVESKVNRITSLMNLLLKGTNQNKENLSGMARQAGRLNTIFNGLSKIGRDFTKNLRPVGNILKAAASATSKLSKGLHLDGTLKKLSKYLLALFSIRGAYAAINTVANHWLDSSSRAAQQLSVNMDYLKYALGSAVAPVIEYITNLIYSLLKALQALIYALTGINIFANAFAKNMKKAAGSASKVKKELSLAPFDELNSIGKTKNSGSGGGSGSLMPTFDLTEVDFTYNKWVEKLIKFFEPLVKSWRTYGGELKQNLKETAIDISSTMGTVWKSFEKIITNGTVYNALNNILKIIKNISTAFRNAWKLDNNGDRIIQNLADTLNNIFKAIEKTTASEAFQRWLARATEKIREISDKLASINWQPFVDYLAKIGGIIGNAALTILDKFVDLLKWIVEHPNVVTIIGGIAAAFLTLKTIASIGASISKISTGLKAFKSVGGTSKVANAVSGAGEIGEAANSASKNLILPSFKTILQGLAELAIIVGGVEILILATGALLSIPYFSGFLDKGIESLKKVFKGIGEVALELIGVTAAILLLGAIPIPTVALGLAALAIIIAGVETVITVTGLLTKIPYFEEFLDKGGELLIKLATIIGSVAGAFAKSVAGEMSKALPVIGLNLSEFYNNGKEFFEGMSTFNESVAKGALYLSQMILTLTGATILEGLTSWFTGGTNIVKFGQDLAEFGPYLKQYSDSVQGVDASVVEASANAAKTLAEFSTLAPKYDGLAQVFTGTVSLQRFGQDLAEFGPYLKKYSDSVKGVNGNIVKSSADGAKSLAEFANLSPKYGGLAQVFTGNTSVSTFGKDLAMFAPYYKIYADIVKGVDASIVEKSVSAQKSVAEFANIVPTYGGLVQLFTGTTTLSGFGIDLALFAPLYKKYYDNIKSINSDVVEKSANAQKSLAEFANLIPKSGGLAQLFTGNSSVSSFGSDLAKFGQKFKEYYEKISTISASIINSVTNSLIEIVAVAVLIKNNGVEKTLENFGNSLKKGSEGMKSFFNTTFSDSSGYSLGEKFGKKIGEGISSGIKSKARVNFSLKDGGGSTVSSYSLKAYAGGGMPDIGEFFLAGEAGPEWVGSIGNQSAVANQDQMTSILRNAAYEGFTQAIRENPQNNKTDVYIGNDKVYSGYGTYQNNQNNKYGTNVVRV